MTLLIPLQKELCLFLHIFKAQTILCHRQYLMVLGGPKGDCQVQMRSTSLGRDHVFPTNTTTDVASHVPRFCSINSRDELHLQIRNCDQKLPKMDEKGQLASQARCVSVQKWKVSHSGQTYHSPLSGYRWCSCRISGLGIYFQTCGSDYLEILAASFPRDSNGCSGWWFCAFIGL